VRHLTPRQIVAELDRYIVAQHDAKRAVAIAIRNRWRRQQLPDDFRDEVAPKNIIMIGPTGVGKTEIARRLAQLVDAPFLKVEASKYTEVGYHGRDVESMIRDLLEMAIAMIRRRERDRVEVDAAQRVNERLLDLLLPSVEWEPTEPIEPGTDDDESAARRERTRDKMRQRLEAGDLDERTVQMTIEQRVMPIQVLGGMGLEQMDFDFQGMLEKMLPKQSHDREVPVREARRILLEQEVEGLIDREKVTTEAIALTEQNAIVFLDELDKVAGPESKVGPDVSRQGVQRDLLPIVEGTTVQTRYGSVQTDHILFIAAGAFHMSKPSDLMPELQGRFPIRVELQDLTKDDFVRILQEPENALTKQYTAMLATEGLKLRFAGDAVDAIAEMAFLVNKNTQNIGARRLQTMVEKLLEEVSFDAPDMDKKRLTVNAKYVRDKLDSLVADEDQSRYIL